MLNDFHDFTYQYRIIQSRRSEDTSVKVNTEWIIKERVTVNTNDQSFDGWLALAYSSKSKDMLLKYCLGQVTDVNSAQVKV